MLLPSYNVNEIKTILGGGVLLFKCKRNTTFPTNVLTLFTRYRCSKPKELDKISRLKCRETRSLTVWLIIYYATPPVAHHKESLRNPLPTICRRITEP